MAKILKSKLILCGVLASTVVLVSLAWSHCQIPCGIYNDQMRFDMISEHIATVEKSIKQITELSAEPKPNMNQIVRWVNNKDEHADEIAEIVSYYFMAQRIALPDKTDPKAAAPYVQKLTLLHEMLVYSMKAKQSADNANVEKLKSLLAAFDEVYYGKDK
ncbi:MAG TPA: superoxide dismutase [Ni] [Sedimentisphaerales bacterium]|nr:superoxide dismutase [Ni] [Sedimentisphaerales bacterium]